MTKNKKLFLFVLKVLTVTFLSFVVLEIISFISLSPEEKKIPIEKLISQNHNQFLQDFSLQTGCTFAETLIGHSMLGFVHRQPEYLSSKCKKTFWVNNIGVVSSRDLPLIKNNNEFAIMILGGSVAQKLSDYKDIDGNYYLEKMLNHFYLSPNKKPFKIYNGALGAWSMPNQLNMMLMYGERVDGVISIDGYNESFALQEGRRLEQVPTASFVLANSSRLSFRVLGLKFLWAYQYALSRSWLKYSYFFNVTYKILTGIYQRHVISPELIEEYSIGNSEKLKLPLNQAQSWSMDSLKRYIINFHHLGRDSNILTAQFLQPTRLYGKILTNEEKRSAEFIQRDIYLRLDFLYQSFEKEKFNIHSLTNLFQEYKDEIYDDNIHFKMSHGISIGNEKMAQEISEQIAKFWKLRKIKNE